MYKISFHDLEVCNSNPDVSDYYIQFLTIQYRSKDVPQSYDNPNYV